MLQSGEKALPPAMSFEQQASNGKYRLVRADLSHFDEDDAAQMTARAVLARLLRKNRELPRPPSSACSRRRCTR
jgi:hypothetical protein